MRARNVKPSLFKNELLATSDPLNTWIFEGLWCIADREGRLEDRPRRIHLEINPGRAYEGTEAALVWLAEHGFILRYTHGTSQYIQVINFDKHQNPHPREVASVIPAPGIDVKHDLGVASESTYINESQRLGNGSAQPRTDQSNAEALSSRALSPSPFPIPSDPPSLITAKRMLDEDVTNFESFKAAYPQRSGNQPWVKARRAISARLDDGATWSEILGGTQSYAQWCAATGKVNTEHVMQAATFCGPDKPFLQLWKLPASKADVRLASNLDAAAVAKQKLFGSGGGSA